MEADCSNEFVGVTIIMTRCVNLNFNASVFVCLLVMQIVPQVARCCHGFYLFIFFLFLFLFFAHFLKCNVISGLKPLTYFMQINAKNSSTQKQQAI